MKRVGLILVLPLLLVACSKTGEPSAETEAAAPPLADLAAGREIATKCAGCHGEGGVSTNPEIPHLAGQNPDYLLTVITAYQSGERQNEAMQAAVQHLGEADVRNVAAYYAEQELPPAAGTPAVVEQTPAAAEEDPAALGQAASAACGGCHGPDGNSPVPGTPSLAGMSEKYLMAAINAYRSNERQNPVMNPMVAALSEADVFNISVFYSQQTPTARSNATGGDPETGKTTATACAGCHGEDGNSTDPANPSLAGQDGQYLAMAITAYRDGARKSPVMGNVAAALSDEEIRNLAAFYTTLEPKAPDVRKPLSAEEWAERCNRCHGPDGHSANPQFPSLAGQQADYIIKALEAYQKGDRKSSAMHAMSYPLSEKEIHAIARFYAGK